MKKFAFLALILLGSLNELIAGDPWVIADGYKIPCKKVRIGVLNMRAIMEDGKKVVIPWKRINAYSLNGRVYSKRILYQNGKASDRSVFMEKIKDRDGYTLLKFPDQDVDPLYDSYYIYRDDQYCMTLDESLSQQQVSRLFSYFGLKAVYP